MFYLRLALLNLLRAPMRAALSSGAIIIGVFYLIVGQSVIMGSETGAIYGVVHGLTGHVTVRPGGYPTDAMDHPVDEVLTVTPELRSWLDANTEAWTERTLFVATVTAGGESMRLRGVGFDPARDEAVFSRKTWTVEQPVPATAQDGVLVPSGVARLLKVDVGDSLIIQSRSHNGALNALEAKVAAVGRLGNMVFDNGSILVPDPLAKELLRTPGPTHVSMHLSDRNDSAEVKASLQAMGGDQWSVVDWWDDAREMVEVGVVREYALNIIVALLMVMSAMAIANTILMAAHERTHEVGTLRAMGMSRKGVLALFLAEGGFLGAVAGGIGAAMGAAFALWLTENPMDIDAMKGQAIGNDVQVASFIYGEFTIPMVVVPFLLAIVVALLASIYPARLASLMEPADAVRAE